MLRSLMLLPLVLLFGCGGGDEPTPPTAPSGNPEDLTYAPALNVDLSAMQRRASGLYVQDLTVGTGAEAPTSGRSVVVHYTGWLANGTKFDSSRDRGQTFTFVVGKGDVIKGWDEGVPGMKVGGKRKLVIPASLAYGSTARGSIPANSVLVFDVELISIL
ncbi:MAG TPA: FKBP-type peptidyl-prolyl cis-trans isomerase [Myxococcaceae bacterium]|nr:FKBP-type peptidyl-prolyl cis-trans isomerase [Myxococcaceae bacterium]